jgi:hypothetical protein
VWSRAYAVGLAAAIVAFAAAPAGGTGLRTSVTVFRAFTPTGAPEIKVHPVSGSCFTGSLTAARSDAWRCIVGNNLYDPCFSSPQAPGVVICPNRDPTRGTEIRLTKGLPTTEANHGTPSTKRLPWAVELYSGAYCALASGALSVVDGLPGDYFCGAGAKNGLWGSPRRSTEPWTIFSAPLTATSLSHRVSIRHAWT